MTAAAALTGTPTNVVELARARTKGVQSPVLRESRHPDARAAREQADWLSWLKVRELRSRTIEDYLRAADLLLATFPDTAFADFTEGDLSFILSRWRGETFRTKRAAFNSWFGWGVAKGHIARNPIDGIPTPKKKPQKYIETFTPAERAALTGIPNPDGILMLILLETGIRKGEARRLRVRDCKVETREVVIRNGKGGKDRVVRMSRKLQTGLADFFLVEALSPGEYMWYGKPGGGRVRRHTEMGETGFVRWWARCTKLADVEYIPRSDKDDGRGNPHVTRHTFATEWLRDGGRLLTLSRVLGHASIRTTADLYGHLDQRDIAADFDLIEGRR